MLRLCAGGQGMANCKLLLLMFLRWPFSNSLLSLWQLLSPLYFIERETQSLERGPTKSQGHPGVQLETCLHTPGS